MPATSLLSLQPTFLQGFVVGQISILLLLALILKYLFFESAPPGSPTVLAPLLAPRFQQRDAQSAALDAKPSLPSPDAEDSVHSQVEGIESVEWFNLIIREVRSGGSTSDLVPSPKRKADDGLPAPASQIVQSYRIALRDGLGGLAGDEVVRQRVEHWINNHIGSSFIVSIFTMATLRTFIRLPVRTASL
jgi:maintenance of morphology protein 1